MCNASLIILLDALGIFLHLKIKCLLVFFLLSSAADWQENPCSHIKS